MTAKTIKHRPMRAFALLLPALALPLTGCGGPSREEELTKELEQVKQELEQAKAAQMAAEKTAQEAKDAYACAPRVVEYDPNPENNEDSDNTSGNMDDLDHVNNPEGPGNQYPQAERRSNPDFPAGRGSD